MNKKQEKVWMVLNCFEKPLVIVSTIAGCVSLVGIPLCITSSGAGLQVLEYH